MTAWHKIASKWIVRDQWISLRADTCQIANGHVIEPYYVIEERDWVHVFAQDEHGKVLLVTQFRYAAGVECTELPGGVVDAGEEPLDAARRELLEETGYGAAQWRKIGQVFANPARQTNAVHLYLASGLSVHGEQRLDQTEEIAVTVASVDEIKAMIASGEFSQSLHIASFYMSLEAIKPATSTPAESGSS